MELLGRCYGWQTGGLPPLSYLYWQWCMSMTGYPTAAEQVYYWGAMFLGLAKTEESPLSSQPPNIFLLLSSVTLFFLFSTLLG